MKTKLTFLLLVIFTTTAGTAQLNGSGNIITKNYSYQNFDKIELEDLNGKVFIETGTVWSVNVAIDDNLFELLKFDENPNNHSLTISLKDNKNNSKYVENTNIKIKITMPVISLVANKGNSIVEINNLNNTDFKFINTSNGDAFLRGKVTNLEIQNYGNGNVEANKLSCKTAIVKCLGNGDATLNSEGSVQAKVSGNGNVTNLGQGKFSKDSVRSGNGKLIFTK